MSESRLRAELAAFCAEFRVRKFCYNLTAARQTHDTAARIVLAGPAADGIPAGKHESDIYGKGEFSPISFLAASRLPCPARFEREFRKGRILSFQPALFFAGIEHFEQQAR